MKKAKNALMRSAIGDVTIVLTGPSVDDIRYLEAQCTSADPGSDDTSYQGHANVNGAPRKWCVVVRAS